MAEEAKPAELEGIATNFADEFKLIDSEIKQVDDLYGMVLKEIKDARGGDERNARLARGASNPNTFIYNMFANANSVKSSKISLIAHRIALKKTIEELKLKTAKGEDEGGKIKMVLAELIKEISDNKVRDEKAGKISKEAEVEDEEELKKLGEEAFQEALDENPKIDVDKLTKEKKEEDDEEQVDESRLAISTDGKLYFLDENGDIDQELELDEKEFYIERDDDGLVTFAKTISTNKEIQIIAVEEE